MINALNGANSILHSIGNGFRNSHNSSSQNSSLNGSGSNGRNYMSCSPHSTSSDTSTSPQLNVNNTSLNSTTSANSSSASTNHSQGSSNSSSNNSTNGILSINKNMNNTDRTDERNGLSIELGLNSKNSLSAFYSNGQSLLNHSLIAAYHEQNGRRNSSDHEEENNINNLNSLITNSNETSTGKLEQNGSVMVGLELMDKCRLTNQFNEENKFGHLGINGKQTLSEQECAVLNATLKNFEENLAQSNSLPFKLRHKTRTSSNQTDQTSDASCEESLSSGK